MSIERGHERQSDIDIKAKVAKLIENENNQEKRIELGVMLEFSELFVGLKNALISSVERIDREHLDQKEKMEKEHLDQAEKINRLSASLLAHIETTNAIMNRAKGARYTLPVLVIAFGLTGSLITIIYHNLTERIKEIQIQHNNLSVQQSAIQNQQVQIMSLINDLKFNSHKKVD